MAQVINTNVGALFAGAALNKSALALQTAQQRLSSGLRINSAKDDSTGLGIAVLDDAKIRGANMNIRNANDAISRLRSMTAIWPRSLKTPSACAKFMCRLAQSPTRKQLPSSRKIPVFPDWLPPTPP